MVNTGCRRHHGIVLLLLSHMLCACSGAVAGGIHFVNSRDVNLSWRSGGGPIDAVHVWFSRDEGQSWHEAQVEPARDSALRFVAQNDGKYLFYIVLENGAGVSDSRPGNGSGPHLTTVFDTAPPTLQFHGAELATTDAGEAILKLRASVVDENLGPAAARVFYRTDTTADWQDGGTVEFADGTAPWSAPAETVSNVVDLRLVVTDLAGNRATDEIRDIPIPPGPSTPTTAQSNDAKSATSRQADEPDGHIPGSPVTPVTVEPVPPVTLDADSGTPPTTQPLDETRAQLARLREQANRYLAEGRLSLASARLQDALQLAPDDTDLLVDFGSVLFRNRQYAEADRRFRLALKSSPDHVGAIEGLALVAAIQNRYPDARSHLQHLLRLRPESAEHWLHLGDIEYKLGNRADAHDAWEHALKLAATDETAHARARQRLTVLRRTATAAK